MPFHGRYSLKRMATYSIFPQNHNLSRLTPVGKENKEITPPTVSSKLHHKHIRIAITIITVKSIYHTAVSMLPVFCLSMYTKQTNRESTIGDFSSIRQKMTVYSRTSYPHPPPPSPATHFIAGPPSSKKKRTSLQVMQTALYMRHNTRQAELDRPKRKGRTRAEKERWHERNEKTKHEPRPTATT